MGEFAIIAECPHGRVQRAVARNSLMWRAQGRLLRRIFPPASGGAFTTSLGFGGPAYQGPRERPQLWDLGDFYPGRRGRWQDYASDDLDNIVCLEGGAIDNPMRALFGYARKPVALTLEDDPKGITIDTGWKQWTNALSWERHGDWTPQGYYDNPETPAGSFRQPYKYFNCLPPECDHGYPWCSPRVANGAINWWLNHEPPYRCRRNGAWDSTLATQLECENATPPGIWQQDTYPDNRNIMQRCYRNDDWDLSKTTAESCTAAGGDWRTIGGVACSSCASLFWMDGVAGVPIGVVFLTFEESGQDPLILAAAQFSAPLMWRPGGRISVRYRGRFWTP